MKHLRRMLAASLLTGSLVFAPEIYCLPIGSAVVHAEVREYVGVGESIVSDRETIEIGKQGAILQALRNAQEKAGVFIGSYSVMRDHELDTDEVIAFTAGIVKVNENIKYEPIPLGDDLGTMKYRATVVVTIDTDELTNQINAWLKRNSRDRSNIVAQTQDLQNLIDQQAKRIKELEKTVAASKTQNKEDVRKEISKIETDTQIIQKTSDGNRAYYNGDYSAALDNYSDVLKLKEFEIEGKGTASGKYAKMLARRAAIADAFRQIDMKLQDYIESRKPSSLKNDDKLQHFLNEMIKRSQITNEILNADGSYSIKLRLRPEDVDKLKAYLESAQ